MSEPVSILKPVAATIRDVLRDTNHENNWPEDAAHENGNYYNKCNSCKQPFIGHTRRACCRKCNVANQAVVTKTITTYSLDGSSWTTKRPPMCKIYYTREVPPISEVETSTIPTELLEAYVGLLRAVEIQICDYPIGTCHALKVEYQQVIRLGGGK